LQTEFRKAIEAMQVMDEQKEMHQALLLDRQAILMLDVSRIYFQVMHSERQIAVLRHSIEGARQRLKDIPVKQQAGVARPLQPAAAGRAAQK
jgi:outer membrane protein TolC